MAVCENSGAYGGLVKFLLEWIKSVGQARFDSLLLHKVVLSYNIAYAPGVRENVKGHLGRHGATEERFESFSPHQNKSAKVN